MRLAHGSGIDGLRGMDAAELRRRLRGLPAAARRSARSAARGGQRRRAQCRRAIPAIPIEHYERVRWRLMLPALEAHGTDARAARHVRAAHGRGGSLVHPTAARTPIRGSSTPVSRRRRSSRRMRAIRHAQSAPSRPSCSGRCWSLSPATGRSPPLGALELLSRRLQQLEPLKGMTLHGCLVSSDGETILVTQGRAADGASRAKRQAEAAHAELTAQARQNWTSAGISAHPVALVTP